jgi:predicted nucleic acid-binding protein
MRIIVSDSSCLIDLRKASLLDTFQRLPYEVLIPNTLFEDELLKFTTSQKQALIAGGLKVVDLPSARVVRARQVIQQAPRLSIHDAFAFVLAESHPGCILLTGDGHLRALASDHAIEVHGLLWVLDELHTHGLCAAPEIAAALRTLEQDPAVRLPRRELMASIRRFESGR